MCAVDLTEVLLASSLQRTFNAAWLEYSGVPAVLEKRLEYGDPGHGVTDAAANCKTESLIADPPAPKVLDSYRIATLGARTSWSPQRIQSSQHII